MNWSRPEDEANDDFAYAMTDGFNLGKLGRQLTEDDLIMWPTRLRKPFRDGFEAGYAWFKERHHDPR